MFLALLIGSLTLLVFLLLLHLSDVYDFEGNVWALNVQCINTAPCTQTEDAKIQCLGDFPCVGIQPPNLNMGDLNSLTNDCNGVLLKSAFSDNQSQSKMSGLLNDPNLESNLFGKSENYRSQCHNN
jgi:hypothetical protein